MQTFAPITIFGTTYRLWSSILARQILAQWAAWLPFEVAGGVPLRNVRDISYCIQALVEESLASSQPLAGFSIDLVRCFNHLPRAPIGALLKHLGVDAHLVAMWLNFLSVAQRSAMLAGSLCSPFGASTGVPEGDAVAVVAVTAVCWMLCQLCKRSRSDARLLTYIDNFTWLARTSFSLKISLLDAQAFCASLRVPIEWRKSFCWATSAPLRRWWDTASSAYLPEGVRLTRVDTAKDLGVVFQFRARIAFHKGEARLEEGRRRIEPQCFYGLEGRALPVAVVEHLRGRAARALCNSGPAQSAFLVLQSCPGVVDPAVFLLVQAVMALRRAFRAQPELARMVLRLICQHRPGAHSRGPASALAILLARGGWEIALDGLCRGPVEPPFRSASAADARLYTTSPSHGPGRWPIGLPTVMALQPWARWPCAKPKRPCCSFQPNAFLCCSTA